jgi:cell division protein FtsB
MTFRPSLPRRSSSDQPANSLTSYTHITIWTLSMETQDYSSQEVERLKSENATLRRRIQTLEAEIARLRDKLVSAWGSC